MVLWDQAMAFEWIKKNIGHFGGDPYDMLLFGESAGGRSVSIHLVSPITRKIFTKAIIQSGTVFDNRFISKNRQKQLELSKLAVKKIELSKYMSEWTILLDGLSKVLRC